MTPRGRLLFLFTSAAAAVAVAASCTTFNFPYPEPEDAAAEGACTAEAGTGYLAVDQAVRACSFVTTCPGLAVSISASIALPLDQTGGSYAACVNWLAGSTTANRAEFAFQAQMLACIAGASSCDAAIGCTPIRPIDAGCNNFSEDCLDGGAGIVRCIDGVELESPCGPPIWADASSCFIDRSLGIPIARCGTNGASCSPGVTCTDGTTLSVCPTQGSANEPWSVNCSVFGEVCSSLDCNSPLDAGLDAGAICGLTDQGISCTSDSRAIRYCNREPQLRSTFDCSQSGRTCVPSGSAAYCRGPCDTCSPFDQGMGRCVNLNGTVGVTLCIDGVPSTYGCNCVPDPSGGHCE
jgi:hypothetical protein